MSALDKNRTVSPTENVILCKGFKFILCFRAILSPAK